MEDKKAILLFDGICRLCNGLVRFLVKKDKAGIFEYVSIQSETGQQILKNRSISNTDSVVLIFDHTSYIYSDAVIQIAKLLSFPWNCFRFLKFIPKSWRDYLYHVVSKNRYKWFGKLDSCKITIN